MKLRYRAILAVLIGPVASLCARTALGAEGACPPLVVDADDEVSRRFPRLPERVREAFDGRLDIDACARIQVTMNDGIVNVEARLPDGRVASRRVSRPADVVPTLEALLLLPRREVEPTPEPERAPPPADSPDATLVPASTVPHPAADAPSSTVGKEPRNPAPAPERLGFELSLFADARAGDGQTGAGVGVCSFVDVAGWLVGFEGRSDQYGITGGPAGTSLELAALGGRRFRFENLALDVSAGPSLALRAGSETRSAPANGTRAEPPPDPSGFGSDVLPGLLLGTRLHFATHSVFRTFVGADAELALSRAGGVPDDAPRLPAWTVGLSAGATVGTP